MRSSSAHTSAIRPEMTMRPAQSGRMPESASRTMRKVMLERVDKRGLQCFAEFTKSTEACGPRSNIESLLAVCVQAAFDVVRTGLRLESAADESAVFAREFLRRLIQGASAWTGALQKGCTATFEKLMIFMNTPIGKTWDARKRRPTRRAKDLFLKFPVLLPVGLAKSARCAGGDYIENLPRIRPTASPSSSNGSPG